MSKRKALVQGRKETGLQSDDEEKMSSNESNTPKQATAAQLARRKILPPRRGPVGPRPGAVRPPGPSQPSLNSNPFGSLDSNAMNPGFNQQASLPAFNFGQAANQQQPQQNGLFGQQAQSFPQTNFPSTQQNGGSNSFSGFGSGTNSSSFSFNVPQTGFQFPQQQSVNNNPFGGNAMGQNHVPVSSGFSGFTGGIFNIPSTSAPPSSGSFNTTPSSNPFSLTPSTSAPLHNLFGNPTSSQPTTQPSMNIFGNSSTTTSGPTSNIFGATPTTTSAPASNIFGATPTTTSAPANNIFGATPATTSAPTTKIWGDQTPAEVAARKRAPLPNSHSPELMQTSPDATPAKPDTPKQNPWSSLAPAAPTNPAFAFGSVTPGSTALGNMFAPKAPEASIGSSASASTSTPAASTNPLFGSPVTKPTEDSATPAPSGGDLFGNGRSTSTVSTPSLLGSSKPSASAPALFGGTTPSTSATGNMFGTGFTPTTTEPSASEATPNSTGMFGSTAPSGLGNSLLTKKPDLSEVAAGKQPARDEPSQTLFSGSRPFSQAPLSKSVGTGQQQSGASKALVPASESLIRGEPIPPVHYDDKMKDMYKQGWKLRSLNKSFQKKMAEINSDSTDVDKLIRFYLTKRDEMGLPFDFDAVPMTSAAGSKRKASDDTSSEGGPGNNKRARPGQDSPAFSTPTPAPSASRSSSTKQAPNQPANNAGTPADRRMTTETTANSKPLQPMPTPGARRITSGPSANPPMSSTPLLSKKRPAQDDGDRDADEQSGKRSKDAEGKPQPSGSGSQTSNLFRHMLDKSVSGSSDVADTSSQDYAASASSAPGLSALSGPQNAHPTPSWGSGADNSSNTFGSQSAGSAITSAAPGGFTPMFGNASPNSNSTPSSNPFGFQPTTSASTPSAPSTSRPLFGNNDQNYSSNASGNLFGTQTSVIADTSSSPGGFKPMFGNANQSSSGSGSGTSASTNVFANPAAIADTSASKPVSASTDQSSTAGASTSGGFITSGGFMPQLPSSSAPATDFLAKFAADSYQQVKKNAKDADWDSEEETAEEWSKRYDEEQTAKKLQLQRARRELVFENGEYSFSEKEDHADEAASESDTQSAQAAPSNLFQPKPSPLSQDVLPVVPRNQHLVNALNSGASTPSTTGGASVFDEPRNIGLQVPSAATNIFGYLSGEDSGRDSRTGDADDEGSLSAGSNVDGGEDRGENGDHDDDAEDGDYRDYQDDDEEEEDEEDDSLFVHKEGDFQEGDLETPWGNGSDEANGSEEQASSSSVPSNPAASGRDLFSRISYGEDGKPLKAPVEEKKDEEAPQKKRFEFDFSKVAHTIEKKNDESDGQVESSNVRGAEETPRPFGGVTFGQSSSQNGFGSSSQGGSSIFGNRSTSGDHTWTQGSPIRFGTTPSVNVTSPSPTPTPAVNGTSTTAQPFLGLFGQNSGTSTPNSSATGIPKSTGFTFGGPKTQADRLAAEEGAGSSRASSPGATTSGGETDADPEVLEQHPQANLMSGQGEEDEDVLFEVRGKAHLFTQLFKDDGTPGDKSWVGKGVGPVRLLKDKNTGKCRILHRQDPNGRVLINAALIPSLDYDYARPKAFKFLVAKEDGGFDTWLIRTSLDADAHKFADLLQKHKSD